VCQLSIAFVAEGNADTVDCWSGCAQGFVKALRLRGARVQALNAELRDWRRWSVAAGSFHPTWSRWCRRFSLGAMAFRAKSAAAARALRSAPDRFDAVIQIGATFAIPPELTQGVPHVIYADSNVRYAWRGRPYSGVSALTDQEADDVAVREQKVYATADRLWTWSRALAESFVEDFGEPPDKLRTIYAGANLHLTIEPSARGYRSAPSVLFVGKDYPRKGFQVLLEAFARVRDTTPNAELNVVGAKPAFTENVPGVVSHGFIRPNTIEGITRLRGLYRRATVFCLPSRYEPFGVAFIEAMLAGLPCIGVNRWAMPEIIAQGETGWLVPDGDVDALAASIEHALHNPEHSAAMGQAGRRRALRLFTWDRVAQRALSDLAQLRAGTSAPELRSVS